MSGRAWVSAFVFGIGSWVVLGVVTLWLWRVTAGLVGALNGWPR